LSGEKLENLPPTTIAGSDQEIEAGQTVILDGNKSSDPNQDPLTFQWKFVSVPEGSQCQITNADKVKAAFTPKIVGEYFVQLLATDSLQLASVPDKIKITVFSKAEVLAIEQSKKQQEEGFSPEQIQHRRYIRKVFFDTFNRAPSIAEYSRFQNQSPEQVVDQILSSYEFWENWYEDELFYFLLIDNFRPANEALLSIPERLHKKQFHTREAIQSIVISQYFNARNPGNDTWVTVVFEQLLGMKVQEKKNVKHLVTGKKIYDGYKEKLFNQEGKSQADVIYITLAQDIFYELYILRHYERYFGEKPKKEAVQPEIEQYKADPGCYSTIVKQWLLSQKYRDSAWKLRSKTDFKFVRALYVDLLGRRPSFEEYRLLRNALQALSDSRPLRTILVKLIVESGQFTLPEKSAISNSNQWIREQFFRYLCRFPTEQELSIWSSTFPQRFCSPQLMVEALLLNREYNSY
ncbi:MAG: PKD domain-containing protein, partial [Planctomycetota bacterium]